MCHGHLKAIWQEVRNIAKATARLEKGMIDGNGAWHAMHQLAHITVDDDERPRQTNLPFNTHSWPCPMKVAIATETASAEVESLPTHNTNNVSRLRGQGAADIAGALAKRRRRAFPRSSRRKAKNLLLIDYVLCTLCTRVSNEREGGKEAGNCLFPVFSLACLVMGLIR